MYEIIFEEIYLDRQFFKYINICGPGKSGKTSFLSSLMKYFEISKENEESQDDSEKTDCTHKNCHPIIYSYFAT